MHAALIVPFAVLFVLLATFNVWSILSTQSGSTLHTCWRASPCRAAAGYGMKPAAEHDFLTLTLAVTERSSPETSRRKLATYPG